METFRVVAGVFAVSGAFLLTTSVAADTSEYVHFTRHRDSNGHLVAGPTQPQSQSPAMIKQKTGIPVTPNIQERRPTDWGMNAQEVKMNEPVQPVWELYSPVLEDNEQRVVYRSQIEGIDASLTYTFYENKLAQANYLFEPKHEDAVDYVRDFQQVKDWIIQSYGMPASVQEIWLDDSYRYDKSLWGQAIMRGHLKIVAEWQNDTTHITLLLDGGQDSIGLLADFDSVVFVPPGPIEASIMKEAPSMEKISNKEVPALESEPSADETSTETDTQEPRPGMAL